jgi:hypothetical protein
MSRVTPSLRTMLCLLLVAAALLLRAGVPQGWMAGQGADGGIAITMCNSSAKVVIPMKPGHVPQGQDEDADLSAKACAFAGHHAAATPPDGLVPLPLPQLAEAAYDATREQALSPDSPRVLPPATGPPARA